MKRSNEDREDLFFSMRIFCTDEDLAISVTHSQDSPWVSVVSCQVSQTALRTVTDTTTGAAHLATSACEELSTLS